MRVPCNVHADGTIELYFYEELDDTAHASVRAHLAGCGECAQALEELQLIRAALSSRPDVSAPPSGDWTSFMARLDAAVQQRNVLPFAPPTARTSETSNTRTSNTSSSQSASQSASQSMIRRPFAGLIATAALLAVVAISVFMASRGARELLTGEASPAPVDQSAGATPREPEMQAAMTAVGLRHLERSKLVVLGLAAKDAIPDSAPGQEPDWAYERELATSLLNDTRIYRQAAEQRGLTRLAAVMRDLELVLLQASMAEAGDRAALPQIQRLIHKRGLVEKMDVVGATGILP